MSQFKSVALWCWKNQDKLLKAAVLVSGFVGPAWATYVTPAMQEYSPISWVAAGFAGLAAVTIILVGWAFIYSTFSLARRTAQIIEKSGVNPLDERFDRKNIRLLDFYRPQYVPHKDKDFRNCEVTGPGLVYFTGVTFDHCKYRHVQIVVVGEGNRWGMTVFENAKFLNCDILNITMMMSKAAYETLPQDIKDNVPVINGQFP